MISRDALYAFIESLIDDAEDGDALFEAQPFRNLRTSIDEAQKVIRVECFDGMHDVSPREKETEKNVRATVQCWVKPDIDGANGDEELAVDTAADLSFDMSKEIFNAIAQNPGLNGGVCDSSFQEFETGEANLGGRRGVTFLDGVINQAS